MSFTSASLLLKNEWVNRKVKQSLSPRMKFKKIKRMKMLKKGRREHIYIFSTVSEAENRRNSEKIILKRY